MLQKTIPPDELPRRLREFTARNACRHTVCETHERAIEREVSVNDEDAPFLGVTFDPWDRCIRILLGDMTGTPYYRTVAIANASDVEVLSGRDGREEGLRIRHPGGSTILRFVERRLQRPRYLPASQYADARKGARA